MKNKLNTKKKKKNMYSIWVLHITHFLISLNICNKFSTQCIGRRKWKYLQHDCLTPLLSLPPPRNTHKTMDEAITDIIDSALCIGKRRKEVFI